MLDDDPERLSLEQAPRPSLLATLAELEPTDEALPAIDDPAPEPIAL